MTKRQELSEARTTDFLTIEEAAGELGIKPAVLRNYLYADKLTTYKFKMLTLVSRNEVANWKQRQSR